MFAFYNFNTLFTCISKFQSVLDVILPNEKDSVSQAYSISVAKLLDHMI